MPINFSIPNIPSLTKTKPDGGETIFVPDIKYLVKFSKGDLGISDAIMTSTILNTASTSKNKNATATYLKNAGGIVDSPEKYVKNGKLNIPASAITLDPSKNEAGLKALEKSIIQSIFDSQKPYMEMIGQLSNVLIFVEDIIARVLALGGRSLKPETNPRALGYKQDNKIKTKKENSKLNSLAKNKSDGTKNDDGTGGNNQSNNGNLQGNSHFEIESIVYSTGEYNPNVDYTYEYIDIIKPEPIIKEAPDEQEEISDLPKTLIIAIFDNNGNIINGTDVDNRNFGWLSRNKWYGGFNYLSDNDADNINLYNSYYEGYARENLTEMSEVDRQNIVNRINNLNSADNSKTIRDQIDNLKKENYFKAVNFTNPDMFSVLDDNAVTIKPKFIIEKKAFAPKKVNIGGVDKWIDPETDYEFKLIRVDSINKGNDNDINVKTPISKGVYDSEGPIDIERVFRNRKLDNNVDKIVTNTPVLVSTMTLNIEQFNGIKKTNANISNQIEVRRIGKLVGYTIDVTGDVPEGYRDKVTSTRIDTIEVINHRTYFILEGILAEDNKQSYDSLNPGTGNNENSNSSFSYYKKKAFFSAPKQFVKLIIQLATKLEPSIAVIAKLATNPSEFITTIMKLNLGDNLGSKDVKFLFFSSEFTKKFGSLNSGNKKKIIKNSVLKNFVVVNKDGSHKFLLAGSGFAYLKKVKIGHSVSPSLSFGTFSSTYPVTPTANNVANSNNLNSNINFNSSSFTNVGSETIDYIGGYNPNVTYKFIYINKIIMDKLQEGQDLEDKGDLDGALSNYNEALKLDPSNKVIADKIEALKKVIGSFGGNALFSFILNMILLPLDIVIDIIAEIVKILKEFTSPTKLQDAIKKLVSFSIFPGGVQPTDFFKPLGILKLAKINFDIELFMQWVAGVLVSPLESYDLNKVLQLPFVPSFPTFTASQFKSLLFGHKSKKPNVLPLKLLTSILKIFEGIINAIISFFWALMGIGGLLKKPVLKFTKDDNADISASDLQALVNGTYTDVINPNATTGADTVDNNTNFIYNIQLPDGRTLRQLDKEELQKFIEDNKDFQYTYNF
jgi:hypothetical protein